MAFPLAKTYRTLVLAWLLAVLVLAGCAPPNSPAAAGGAAPSPDAFADPAAFQDALLQALAARDTARLQRWTAEPFMTGVWRQDLTNTTPDDALRALTTGQLGADNRLAVVQDADLKALMGGQALPDLPNGQAILVSGWGKDGRDEAILFIARQADNSFKWHGWLQIQGGFSGARLNGIQPFQNNTNGYSLFLPTGFEVYQTSDSQVMILAPVRTDETRAAAFIAVEPANGLTVDQAVEAARSSPEVILSRTSATLRIEDAQVVVLNGPPGQNASRHLFMVHNNQVYHLTFVPADPQAGAAYLKMEDLYAMIVNTFHFTK